MRHLSLFCPRRCIALCLAAGSVNAKPPKSFNPAVEAQNFSITQQRQTIYDTPQYQEQLSAVSQLVPRTTAAP